MRNPTKRFTSSQFKNLNRQLMTNGCLCSLEAETHVLDRRANFGAVKQVVAREKGNDLI